MLRWSDRAAALLDETVAGTRRIRGAKDPRIDAMGQAERLARLQALASTYAADELLAPSAFFRPAGPIAPAEEAVATRLGPATDLAWPSAYAPFDDLVGRTYLTSEVNRTATARLFRSGPRPGPVVVVVHGYGAGHLRVEQVVWPIRGWLRAGFDVVLPALPFHGKRSEPGRRLAPPFPGADPRFTNEGFRQAVHDLGALMDWLAARGHGPIGLAGMSLGGYTSGLLATLRPGLAFAALVIPLASLADFARDQGRLGEGEVAEALHAALERVFRPTSPFSRPPLVAPDRVRILAALGDRITGVAQAERLGRHFGVEVEVCRGSHLVQRLPWRSVVDWTAARAR